MKNTFIILSLLFGFTQVGFAQKKANKFDFVVGQDQQSKYHSIQEVLNLIPSGNTKPVKIFVKQGVYKEVITVDASKSNILLVGENENNTIIQYDNHAGVRLSTS